MNGVRRLFGSTSSAASEPPAPSPPSSSSSIPLPPLRRPVNGTTTTTAPAPANATSRSSSAAPSSPGAGPSRLAAPRSTRDELLVSLLASEAAIDSKRYAILSSEELEDAKREHTQTLTRLAAAERALTRETKMRDAVLHLDQLDASSAPSSPSSPSTPPAPSARAADAARRVDAAQRELWRVKDRASALGARIREHQAAVLAAALRDAERDDEDSESSYVRAGSPASSVVGRFDGPHLFAGHVGARVPRRRVPVGVVEARAARAEEELGRARAEVEGLRVEVGRAEEEGARAREGAEALRAEAEALRDEADELRDAARAAEEAFEAERAALLAERAAAGERWDEERALWDEEREALSQRARDELDVARDALRSLIDRHGVPLFARDNSLATYVDALGRHLAAAGAPEAQRADALAVQLDAARAELDAARAELGRLEDPASPERTPSAPLPFATDAQAIVALLRPLWDTLPSPETRAAKFGGSAPRPFRAGSPPSARSPSSPSISEMDVRTLKGLYSPSGSTTSPPSAGNTSPDEKDRERPFSVEAFVARVHALVADDRALIERLVRFAQAHDLLRRNAERAQKLAQDSGGALETYQKQVEILERREAECKDQVAQLQRELAEQDDLLDRLGQDKQAIETAAAEQAGTLQQLTESNAALSARVLALAQESADALRERDELRGAGETQQAQQFAVLDELNAVQNENERLRAQLRALGKM
ncbi:Up-regulated during septation-domain-containing protein [Vararia minispora EC-137]|uniref:Up-regulated during septation-domain-containing protein n=1 Tax=Vararia minispora EC-137 TaxID=1314806 RepID=A0ACB8QG01_9AGAM|nr:Up-regulated during septation-domain-containing protein [Vararia minispora EC-137]